MTAVEVLAPGPLALVQDLGRPGLANVGVGRSGAFDRAAHRLANRLVGNPESAAALELLIGNAAFRFRRPAWFAITGAWGHTELDGARVEPHTATRAEGGAVLRIGPAEHGLRFVLAVRGGIDVPPVLGSRSRDTLAALGPDALRPGDVVAIGPEPPSPVPGADLVPVGPPPSGPVRIELLPGPREDWFAAEARNVLTTAHWRVSARADRTGVRLDGPALLRVRDGELPSEGMVPGAIQVSPDGVPTVLGIDAPVTGGYPVIAVVADVFLDAFAQVRPGQELLFARAIRRE